MSIASEAAGASSPRGWLPFRVAIVIVVVGLLIVTCGSLIAYVLYRQTHMAWLYRLGARGGEIESDAPLAVFDALQVLLPVATGGDELVILDGKVVALSEHEGVPTALIRFTGVDWDTQARIEAFAHRDRDTA